MRDSFQEVVSNPVPSAQSGLVSIAYMYVALCSRFNDVGVVSPTEWKAVVSQSMTVSPKVSYLLNPKVFGKLALDSDYKWNLRALTAVVDEECFHNNDCESKDAIGQAFIYAISATGVSSRARDEACQSLSSAHIKNTDAIGNTIIDALWSWIFSLASNDKDSAAHTAGVDSQQRLHLVVKALFCTSSVDKKDISRVTSAFQKQLIKLLVICRAPLIPGASWIDMCLRSTIDPGKLATYHTDECIHQLAHIIDVRAKCPTYLLP
jgi:hypothetical protein